MTVALVLETVAIAAIVYMFLRDRKQAEQAWTVERRELLERIQRPERVPVLEAQPFAFPELPEDDFDKVGTISVPKDWEGTD